MSGSDAVTRAYQDLDATQRKFLTTYVPGLSALLDKHVNDSRPPTRCAASSDPCPRPATGRSALNGTPACAHHGGTFPLDLIDPRTWSGS